MKYLLTLVAIAAIAIGASACGGSDDQATAAEVTTTTVDPTQAVEDTATAVDAGVQDGPDEWPEFTQRAFLKGCGEGAMCHEILDKLMAEYTPQEAMRLDDYEIRQLILE